MTPAKAKYILGRLSSIAALKIKAFEATLPKVPKFDVEEKLQALKKGEFSVNKPKGYMSNLHDYVTFDIQKEIDKIHESNRKKVGAFKAALDSEIVQIMDAAHLGSDSEALEMLHKFERG